MAKCPEQLKEYIKNNVHWYEAAVVAFCRADLSLFSKLATVLCIQPGGKKIEHTDDFSFAYNNVIYEAIRDYNSMFADVGDKAFAPMPELWLFNWLAAKANKAEKVSLSEIPEVLTHFRDHILTISTDESSAYLIKLGIADFLRDVRAQKIVKRVSLKGTNLDDLALMCDGDMQLINVLDEHNKIAKDVPDRIDAKDIELFTDPSKILMNSLDSDIPKLNEYVGGFRKKGAYMFIGATGSGKTVAACQLACAFSYGCKANGLYISTEQTHEELWMRVVSNRCGIPYKVISRGIFKESLSPNEYERYIDFRTCDKHLISGDIRFINWGNFEKLPGFKVSRAIEKEIELYREETGKRVDYIILDWIGGALSTLAAKPENIRHIYQEAADSLEELARKHDLVAVAFSQAHVNAVNKLQISAEDLAECKSMTRNYTGVIGITSMYSESYARLKANENNAKKRDYRVPDDFDEADAYAFKQFLYVSKARFGVQKSVPFKREYEYQKMSPWV